MNYLTRVHYLKPILSFLLLIFLSVGLSYGQEASFDQIILTNGNIVTGKITELNDSMVKLDSKVLGEISIKRSNISSIAFKTTKSAQNQINYVEVKPPKPTFEIPKWYRGIGLGISPFGINLEAGRSVLSENIFVFGKTGFHRLWLYELSTVPVEVGFAFTPQHSRKVNFFYFQGGRSFTISDGIGSIYRPGLVFAAGYRHVFVNRSIPSSGTYLDIGYRGGRLKGRFINWQGVTVERVVNINRLHLGLGYMF